MIRTPPRTVASTPMAEARIESLDRNQAEQARLKALSDGAAPAYQDRFMDPDEIAQSAATEPEAEQPEGFRAWVVESRLGLGDSRTTGYGRQRATEIGQRLEYRRETLNYVQAEGRHLYMCRSLHGQLALSALAPLLKGPGTAQSATQRPARPAPRGSCGWPWRRHTRRPPARRPGRST